MRVQTSDRRDDAAANLKLLIVCQQELAAKLVRDGSPSKAQAARNKLMVLLNQLDLMQECTSQS